MFGLGAGDDGDIDDEELERELMRLQRGEDLMSNRKKPQGQMKPRGKGAQPNPHGIPDLSGLSLDVEADINVELDEADENDPDLLGELSELLDDEVVSEPEDQPKSSQPPANLVSTLEERLKLYTVALASAKSASDTTKVRRLDRGVKTLQDMLKSAKAGGEVNLDEIPPPVSTNSPQPTRKVESPPQVAPTVPPRPKPTEPTKPLVIPRVKIVAEETKVDDTSKLLCERRDQYKNAALLAKQAGDKPYALKYFRVAKQFDEVITAYRAGQPVDLSNLPPALEQKPSLTTEGSLEGKSSSPAAAAAATDETAEIPELSEEEQAKADRIFNAPPPPTSVVEALIQRMEKYKTAATKAKEDGDNSKARRMERLQKQYVDAIKDYKAGRPVNFEELPTPPGFGPIPLPTASAPVVRPKPTLNVDDASGHDRRSAPNLPAQTKPPVAFKPKELEDTHKRHSEPQGHLGPSPPKQSKQEQQLAFLQDRQRLFKEAAVMAKRAGKNELAISYLKQSKGFDQMIEASNNGLPVDITTIPIPPQLRTAARTLDVAAAGMSKSRSSPSSIAGSPDDIYSSLEKDLIRQFQICCQNSECFTKIGDVAKTTMFDKLGADCKRDLDSLRVSMKHQRPPPIFHYESKSFPVLQLCPDLSDSEVEISVLRGIMLKPPPDYEPKDLNVAVRWTFPFPAETPPTGKTTPVGGTNGPTWNQPFKIQVNRKSRSLLRVIKAKSVKFEVFHKGGFLRSDKPLGQFEVKLAPLEENCEIHECFDLLEGRKPCGGKVEVKIRVREPFGQSQFRTAQEKWLVIDQFLA